MRTKKIVSSHCQPSHKRVGSRGKSAPSRPSHSSIHFLNQKLHSQCYFRQLCTKLCAWHFILLTLSLCFTNNLGDMWTLRHRRYYSWSRSWMVCNCCCSSRWPDTSQKLVQLDRIMIWHATRPLPAGKLHHHLTTPPPWFLSTEEGKVTMV